MWQVMHCEVGMLVRELMLDGVARLVLLILELLVVGGGRAAVAVAAPTPDPEWTTLRSLA
jgi:hypothetical protein